MFFGRNQASWKDRAAMAWLLRHIIANTAEIVSKKCMAEK